MTPVKTPTKKPLPRPGRKLSLKEAQERSIKKFGKAYAKLAK
jgi:hypothetical protein